MVDRLVGHSRVLWGAAWGASRPVALSALVLASPVPLSLVLPCSRSLESCRRPNVDGSFSRWRQTGGGRVNDASGANRARRRLSFVVLYPNENESHSSVSLSSTRQRFGRPTPVRVAPYPTEWSFPEPFRGEPGSDRPHLGCAVR